MKFEEAQAEGYKHTITFESDEGEVEAAAAVYTEKNHMLVAANQFGQITQFDRNLSEWDPILDHRIFLNLPLEIAELFDRFHERTERAVGVIASRATVAAFESDAIARRMRLGDKAFQMAGLIKLQYDHDTLDRMLEDNGADMFKASRVEPKTSDQ